MIVSFYGSRVQVSTLSPFGELFPFMSHREGPKRAQVSTLSPFGELFPYRANGKSCDTLLFQLSPLSGSFSHSAYDAVLRFNSLPFRGAFPMSFAPRELRPSSFQLSPLSGSFSHRRESVSGDGGSVVSTLSPFGELFPCPERRNEDATDHVVSTLSPFGELFPSAVFIYKNDGTEVSTLSPFGELFP